MNWEKETTEDFREQGELSKVGNVVVIKEHDLFD